MRVKISESISKLIQKAMNSDTQDKIRKPVEE